MAKVTTAVTKAKVNLPADVNAEMAAEMAAIQSRLSAPSGDRVQATQSKTFKFPNGDEVKDFQAIVIDFVAANMYYEDSYDRNNITPPLCYAASLEPSELKPTAASPEPQAESCAKCPHDKFGSSGKGKACQNTRLLGIIPLDADASTEMVLVKVSPTAIRSFDTYVGSVARAYNLPVRGVITEFSFNPAVEYASMVFKAVGPAPAELVLEAHRRKADAVARLLKDPDFSSSVVAAPKSKGRAKRA